MDVVGILELAKELGGPIVISILLGIAIILIIRNSGKNVTILEKHIDATNALADAVDKNFNPLGKALNEGFTNLGQSIAGFVQTSEAQFQYVLNTNKGNALNVDLCLDLFRDKAAIHMIKKEKFIEWILDRNTLRERKDEIKRNIISYFKTITNENVGELSRYNCIMDNGKIVDLGKIISESIDWEELFEDTFGIVFNVHSTKEQKLFDFKKRMEQYISKIERKIREYGE